MKRIALILLTLWLTACSDDRPRRQALPAEAVILAFGDSLTYGTGASKDTAYPAVLAALSGHQVINAGIPGEVSTEGLARLPKLLEQHQPALVILIHGGNDLLRKLPETALHDNLVAMIELIREHQAQVLLVAVPQPALLLSDAPVYAKVAERTRTPLLKDRLSEILQSADNKADAVHPNAQGYRLLAEAIAATLLDNPE